MSSSKDGMRTTGTVCARARLTAGLHTGYVSYRNRQMIHMSMRIPVLAFGPHAFDRCVIGLVLLLDRLIGPKPLHPEVIIYCRCPGLPSPGGACDHCGRHLLGPPET